ncbi:hypothetical protein GCM10027160_27910 [Streptomyces calidiresistens]|uniref:Uncharacterized protein n=1 Tax=Streptomyces calidiresistens TaxID=1485586 RepID=A0A7W3T2H9_9ACTN|nr:hypothetical protein [Streptomyces calidiresistens]MBB0229727.1 hypothetical protein [Streptomyces calidiresistens]
MSGAARRPSRRSGNPAVRERAARAPRPGRWARRLRRRRDRLWNPGFRRTALGVAPVLVSCAVAAVLVSIHDPRLVDLALRWPGGPPGFAVTLLVPAAVGVAAALCCAVRVARTPPPAPLGSRIALVVVGASACALVLLALSALPPEGTGTAHCATRELGCLLAESHPRVSSAMLPAVLVVLWPAALPAAALAAPAGRRRRAVGSVLGTGAVVFALLGLLAVLLPPIP